ncbi:DUF1553 domain-containing protein [Portibacter lacus]|uniref:DUF1553 domain-containing protein n=1 Tax=Portibacter lacus TaxID=1099794 RepID=A0AA37WE51_9BACT|nr:DUF1553 domain-containing protein [Portibacter lacus]GLR15870.1 hypothetical protein GCM10007940_04850 [Portibacter lacus]
MDYNADVKPILNKHCISCHGGVKQSGGFSLLTEETAFQKTESGHPAIIAGSPMDSEFIRRLKIDDPEERMPLDAEPLTAEEIKTLEKWVKQGAKWQLHWAYKPLTEEDKVLEMGMGSSENWIDKQVAEKLKTINLSSNPKANKAELLRRVALDIIGVPAPLSLQRQYLNDEIDYETLVDSLLASPLFGEKWTSMWLDIARYADSKGFEKDQRRSIWRYRDYVIKSFNNDLPYNQFIVEQLAGDLLENPTEDQLIATGFHRNTTTNDEGGTDNEEYRVKAVMDRVSTTWEGILGTTMACVQCHGHPYDPLPHEEYFKTYAFLNNTRDNDTQEDYPRLNFLDSLSKAELGELTSWIEKVSNNEKAEEIETFVKIKQPIIYSLESDKHVNAALYDTKHLVFRKDGKARFAHVDFTGKNTLLINAIYYIQDSEISLRIDSLNGKEIGRINLTQETKRDQLIETSISDITGIHDLYFVYKNQSLKDRDRGGFRMGWLYLSDGFPGKNEPEYENKKQLFYSLIQRNYPSTLIMHENEGGRIRETRLFDRGNWQSLKQKINPGTPEILPPMEEGARTDRLGFAQWIVNPQNPLTSRTYVNRIWEQLFGRGIVTTVEDLGSQGDVPSHPEVLNRLSYDFMHQMGWSSKTLIKTIVMTATYQQSSSFTPENKEKDPYNIYLSRGPRNRLTAEQIRDQALFVSDQLSSKMFGEPVMPYQPDNIWQSPYSSEQWKMSEGEDRYRRAIYTMLKRTAIYPSMETFDMAQRQVCTSRRIMSNTPLQALVTLNDPVYIDLSDKIAANAIQKYPDDIDARINTIYEKAMSKKISKEKSDILKGLYEETKNELGEMEDRDLIAMSTVANAIINLDDLLNK